MDALITKLRSNEKKPDLRIIHLQRTVHGIVGSNIKTNDMVNDGQIFVWVEIIKFVAVSR